MLLIAGAILLAGGRYAAADETTTARLDSCIIYYEDGDYEKAADSIKALLPLISDRREEAEAYKYLGFSYVMLDLINKAKNFFRVALEKFPQMVIDTLEVPPNISIVFRQAKLETQMEKGEILDKKVQERRTKRTVLASLLTATGAVGLGAGGYFVYKGLQVNRDYQNEKDRTADFDWYINTRNRDYLMGGCASGAGLAALGCGVWMLLHRPAAKDTPKKFGIRSDWNSFALTVSF
jgi:tetratricopeptide (TPR) repeat protein